MLCGHRHHHSPSVSDPPSLLLVLMGQQTRREFYSGPLPSTSLYKDYYHRHHHHHHHHHSYPHDQPIPELAVNDETNNLVSPISKLEGLSQDDIRETAYEIFFTACRSSPGFGGRQAHSFHFNNNHENESKPTNVVMSPTSKVKKALGLKMLKRSPSRRMVSGGSGGSSSPVGGGSPFHHSMPYRPRRPMTSAEIMRQQMRVTEHNDNRLRKTLMRTLVGQVRNTCM